MKTPDPSDLTTEGLERPIPEELENSVIMIAIESLKQGMNNSLKEIEEKYNKKIEEMSKEMEDKYNKKVEEMSKFVNDTLGNQEKAIKQVMESVQELKTEMEAVRKTQSEGRLDMENLGKRMETTESSLTNSIQEIEERVSDYEDTIVKINSLTKKNSKSNKFSSQNIQELWDTIKKTKSKNNRSRRRRRIADQRSRKYTQQNYRRKLPQSKERYPYEGSRSIQNTE